VKNLTKQKNPTLLKLKTEKESDIQRAILEYLLAKKVFCWRNHTTGVYDPRKKVFRSLTGAGALKGVADILGIYQGRPLAIEVKTRKGKPNEFQVAFLDKFRASGGIAFIACSVDDCRLFLEAAEAEDLWPSVPA